MNQTLKKTIQSLPLTSGVYLMKNAKGKVIYVGKAVSLKKRVQSYFRTSKHSDPKTEKLVAAIMSIDHIDTHSEAEALILEASLIKKFKPRYNIDLRDDKTYPYIVISNDKFPRVSIERPRQKINGYKYYGPYINPKLIREALKIIRKIFRFRCCAKLPKKECLDGHIGLCDAPCVGRILKKEYHQIIRNVCLILEGKKDQLYRNLKNQMEALSKAQKYEKAAQLRDQLRAMSALYSGTKDINYFKEAEQLQRSFQLPRAPDRIEAFDVSNIMGTKAVGSMVAFLGGKPDKKNYRRFRIREVEGIDDFKMMAEIVKRRYRRLRDEKKQYPDLIVIDGGKGQLSAAYRELNALGVNIPIVSIAKKQEEVFLPRKRMPIRMSLDSLGLKLLQRIRDESHRFAISYHRKLRDRVSKK